MILAPPYCVERTSAPKHLVVIVGSAGGVRPLVTIASALTPDLDAAIVMMTHRTASKPSYLPQILSRATSAPVVRARNREVLERGWIYVIPPGDRHGLIEGCTIRLVAGPKVHFQRPAADPLFASAARTFGHDAIGVVLSGMGEDGAAGIAAIKQAGGKALIQLPAEAEEPSMPEHALKVVVPDLCAPASELGRRLVALCRLDESAADFAKRAPELGAQFLQLRPTTTQE